MILSDFTVKISLFAVKFLVKRKCVFMSRRGENIYKRKDGRWEGRYVKSRESEKTRYGYVYAKTYKEVKQKLLAVSEVSVHPAEIIPVINFEAVALEWLANMRPQLKKSSVVKYENIIHLHLLPYFGNRAIRDITRDDVNVFCSLLLSEDSAGQSFSPKTVMSIISVMKNIFRYAEQVKRYAVINLNGISVKQLQPQLRILSLIEQQKLSEYLVKNFNLCNLGILLCLYTGIRVGEICALKWGDILFDEQVVYVHQTMQRLQISEHYENKTEILISTPKSDCSMRKIPIPDKIFELIMVHRCPDNAYFLTGLPNKYIEPRTMQNRFKKAISCCNIEDANFHALRHTFATRCIELGFDLKSLSEILGHANVNITLNRYVHPSMELKQQNMNRLSELFAVK